MLALVSGPGRVWHKGTATTFFGHPLRIVLEQGEWHREVELRFTRDGGEPVVESREEPDALVIACRNFDGGRGSSLPVLLGEDGNDLVFLHFRVFLHGDTPDYTVNYTVYRADKEAVQWQPR